ncbi:MAG: LuxR C-terminal-related transcriptional regulator [Planctomycetota bacterium]
MTRTSWVRAVERAIVRVEPACRAALRVYDPDHSARLRGWLVDDLAARVGLDRRLAGPVVLTAEHLDAGDGRALSIAGTPLDAPFLRLAFPVPGLRTPLTLVAQIEPASADTLFPVSADHPLVPAMPAIARAYTHTVGLLEQHRADLLGRLQRTHTATALLLVEGKTEREIAERLGRSQNTIHDHIKRIYSAWGVRTRVAVRDAWCDRVSP